MSAPAMKVSGLPLISTAALHGVVRARPASSASSNSATTAAENLFTGSPGTSIVTTATPSCTSTVSGVGVVMRRSTTIAKPSPPAAQTVMRPNCPPRRASSFASVVVMRAPVAPNGWPIAIEPPITFSCARSTSPTGCEKPARSAQSGDSNPCRLRQHLRGERLVHLDEIDVAAATSPARSSAIGAANTGACSSCSPGSTAA